MSRYQSNIIHCEKSLFVLASRQKIPVLWTENPAVDTKRICLPPIEFFKIPHARNPGLLVPGGCVACIRLFCIGPCQVQQRRRSRAQTQHERGSRDLYPDHEEGAWARGTL